MKMKWVVLALSIVFLQTMSAYGVSWGNYRAGQLLNGNSNERQLRVYYEAGKASRRSAQLRKEVHLRKFEVGPRGDISKTKLKTSSVYWGPELGKTLVVDLSDVPNNPFIVQEGRNLKLHPRVSALMNEDWGHIWVVTDLKQPMQQLLKSSSLTEGKVVYCAKCVSDKRHSDVVEHWNKKNAELFVLGHSNTSDHLFEGSIKQQKFIGASLDDFPQGDSVMDDFFR